MEQVIIKYEINFDDTWNLYDENDQLIAKAYPFSLVEMFVAGYEENVKMELI